VLSSGKPVYTYTHVCDGSNGQSVHTDLHVGPIFVSMATTFALGAESIAYRLVIIIIINKTTRTPNKNTK